MLWLSWFNCCLSQRVMGLGLTPYTRVQKSRLTLLFSRMMPHIWSYCLFGMLGCDLIFIHMKQKIHQYFSLSHYH